MIRTEKSRAYFSRSCPDCGGILRNPGRNAVSARCQCGTIVNPWFEPVDRIRTWDDGRDNLGRFHHAPKLISIKDC